MATNITDVDTFTSPIVAVEDGDPVDGAGAELTAQGLANRTYSNKLKVDLATEAALARQQYCICLVTGSGVVPPAEFSLSLVRQFGGFSVSSNGVVIPHTGTYKLEWYGAAGTTTATADTVLTTKIWNTSGGNINIAGTRFGTDTSKEVALSGSTIVPMIIADVVEIRAQDGGTLHLNTVDGHSILCITRIF